jgi:hypothetical protein
VTVPDKLMDQLRNVGILLLADGGLGLTAGVAALVATADLAAGLTVFLGLDPRFVPRVYLDPDSVVTATPSLSELRLLSILLVVNASPSRKALGLGLSLTTPVMPPLGAIAHWSMVGFLAICNIVVDFDGVDGDIFLLLS